MASAEILSQKAIKAALNGQWYKAIGLNEEILKEDPQNTSALNRLGRAYREIGDEEKAKEYFKKTLRIDPLNTTAEKNLNELRRKRKTALKKPQEIKPEIIVEPATTKKIDAVFYKRYSSNQFSPGDLFEARVDGKKIKLLSNNIDTAYVRTDTAKAILPLLGRGWKGTATYLGGKGRKALFLLKSSTPIFKSQKQNIRPFTKHEHLEEIELDIPQEED